MEKIPIIFALAHLLLFKFQVISAGVGEYCYDEESCGPQSSKWDGVCHTGTRQSPIDIPTNSPLGQTVISIPHKKYLLTSFKMVNVGHTVNIGSPMKMDKRYPSFKIIRRGNNSEAVDVEYIFSLMHYHAVGSEHCVDGNCYPSEIHMVHYRSDFNNVSQALKSGDPEALAVLGVLISYAENLPHHLSPTYVFTQYYPRIIEPSERYVVAHKHLDLGKLLVGSHAYFYPGSLTTPTCNEQVQWIVMRCPVVVSRRELEGIKTLHGSGGHPFFPNIRPLQPLNGRVVELARVRDSECVVRNWKEAGINWKAMKCLSEEPKYHCRYKL